MNTPTRNRSIKKYRQLAGFTQADLAAVLNITSRTYSLKEQGYSEFNDIEMLKVQNELSSKIENLSIDDIFFK